MYSIEKAYSQKVSLFPDPAIHTSDHDYSESVSNSIGMMFLIAMSQFATTTEAISLEVDTSRVMLHVDASISILAMAIAILTAVLAITLILIDLLRIRKEPDELLRFVSEAIVPGRTFVESSAVLIKEVIKNKIPVEEWDSIPIRFGEDRSTIQDPLGRLRFGRKKDVIKFKPGRAYY
jgi:hypothetical protein